MADTNSPHTDGSEPADRTPNGVPPKRPIPVASSRPDAKKDTSRIELSDAEAPTEAPGETLSVSDVAGSSKSETARVRLSDAGPEPDGAQVPLAKDATVRVDLTAVTDTKPSQEPSAADQTARIDVPAQEAAPGAPPRTVRLQRPAVSPKTVVLKRPADASTQQTVVLQRPKAEEGDAAKGQTARISIPEFAAGTPPSGSQRKTIMIKRPSSGAPVSGARKLTISRPAAEAGGEPEGLQELLEGLRSDEPGPAYTVMTLAAVLVLGVLLYVLAAQTLWPELPFPGRIL